MGSQLLSDKSTMSLSCHERALFLPLKLADAHNRLLQGFALISQVPCLTYGMRGMIAASIEVTGPTKDLHSGNDGGAFTRRQVM